MSTPTTNTPTDNTPTTEVLRALFPDEQVETLDYEATLRIGLELLQLFPPRDDRHVVRHVARLFTPGDRTSLQKSGATPSQAIGKLLKDAAQSEETHLEALRVQLKVAELRLERYQKLQAALKAPPAGT